MVFDLLKTEREILELLWEKQYWMSGADFWEYFNTHGIPCKRQTINTYLARMTEKGLLIKHGKKYMYLYTKKEIEEKKAEEVLSNMFDGSLRKFLVALTGNKKINPKEAKQLKQYLDNFEEKG